MNVKEIKNELMMGNKVTFRIKGYNRKYDIFTMIVPNDLGVNVAVNRLHSSMNVKKFGPTCMTLYTFDMMDNKTVSKIKYADVTLIDKVVEVEGADPYTLLY
tara:strand:+ start:953 stop:1258 length:306 start_codon:yes stop_codon:yes gene_type:complete